MVKVEIGNAVQASSAVAGTMPAKEPKTGNKKNIILLYLTVCFLYGSHAFAQMADAVYKENIKAVRFHMYGDQESLPILKLNSGDQLELNFDDLDANVKSYYYSFQLCDYD